MKKKLILFLIFMLLFTNINAGYTFFGNNEEDIYIIQLGLYNDKNNAMRMKEEIEKMNLEASIVEKYGYRVFIGPYYDFEEAKIDLQSARSIVPGAYIEKRNINFLNYRLDDSKNFKIEEKEIEEKEIEEKEIEEKEIKDYNKKLIKTISLNEDKVLRGFYGREVINFSLKDKTVVDSGILKLYINNSPLSNEKYSSVNIIVNGVPIDSRPLGKGSNINYYEIEINPSFLKEENEIEILTYNKLSEDICEDENNPALWVAILEETKFEIEYENISNNIFPNPFIGDGNSTNMDFVFVLENKDPNYIQAMANIVYALGDNKNKAINMDGVELIFLNEINTLSDIKQDFIYIGSNNFDGFLSENEKTKLLEVDDEKEVFIFQKQKDQNGLFIISDYPNLINESSELFLNEEYIKEFNGYIKLSEKDLPLYYEEIILDQIISLKDIGYDGFIINQESGGVEFFMQMPHGYTISKDTRFILNTRYHPEFINSGSLTVYIDGVPMESKKIKKHSGGEEYVFRFPEYFEGKTQFNLEIKLASNIKNLCPEGMNQNLWLYISNSSYLIGPFKEAETFFLESFPIPFLSLNKTYLDAIIYPNNPSNELIIKSMDIIYQLGARGNHKLSPIKVSIGTDIKDMDRIILNDGTVENIKDLEFELNDLSIINESPNTRFLEKNSTIGAGRILKDKSNNVLIFQGLNQSNLIQTIDAFLLEENILGDTFFINNNGVLKSDYILSNKYTMKESIKVYEEIEDINEDLKFYHFRVIIIFMIILFTILFILGLLNRYNKYKKY